MLISLYTVSMTVIWSSILIVIFYILRKKLIFLEVCSVSGIVSIYLFCIFRLFVPIEFPWTQEIDGGILWKGLHTVNYYELFYIGDRPFITGYLFAIVWLGGTLYQLIRIIANYTNLRRYVEHISKKEMKNWLPNVDGIRVYQSNQITSPCATGIIHRVVFLPDREYSKQQEAYILMHEIAHHRNHDILIKLLVNIICAVYWWNPFVYLLKKDINQSLEIRCDKRVTQFLDKEKKAEYLTIIYEEFKNAVENTNNIQDYTLELLGYEDNGLIERFQLVAMGKYNVSLWKRLIFDVLILIVFVSSYAFVIQPVFEAPEEEMENTYYYDNTNSHVLRDKDGRYYLITPYDVIEIEEEDANHYLDDGFILKEN